MLHRVSTTQTCFTAPLRAMGTGQYTIYDVKTFIRFHMKVIFFANQIAHRQEVGFLGNIM